MSIDLEFLVRLTVRDEEEAKDILDASYSGLAGELIRLGVLYGQIPIGRNNILRGLEIEESSTSVSSKTVSDKSTKDTVVKLERVGDVSVNKAQSPEVPKKVERSKGIMGRQRMERG